MALVPGLNIGIGLLILILIWLIVTIAVVILVIIPKARYAIPVVILVAIVITLFLVFYPRSNQTSPNDDDVDQLFIGRTILLLVFMIFAIVGCVLVLVFHWAEPIRAGLLRKPSHLNRY